MERFLPTLLAVALLGCGTAEAQMTSPNRYHRPPSPNLAPTPYPMAVPGTVTAGSAVPYSLGSIQLYLGILSPFPGMSLGAITICPTTGIMGPASAAAAGAAGTATLGGDLISSSSYSAGLYPYISPPPVVAPLPITTPFGTTTGTSICSPSATMTDAASLGVSLAASSFAASSFAVSSLAISSMSTSYLATSSLATSSLATSTLAASAVASTADPTLTSSMVGNAVPLLTPGTVADPTLTSYIVGSAIPLLTPNNVATPDFSDATVPSAATAPGLSPLIIVAPPVISTIAPPIVSVTTCASTPMMGTSGLAMPGITMGATTALGAPSPSGC